MADELHDLKRDFTFNINLTIVFGTVDSAIGFSLLASAKSLNELVILFIAVISNLVPVICDLLSLA